MISRASWSGLLIRRSLVRAQVGEPRKSMGYVETRSPFLLSILDKRARLSNIQYLAAGHTIEP
jgi:hypothetical protein